MRIKKWMLAIVALLICLLPMKSVQAAAYEVVIDDQADLLTDTEENNLYEVMLPITEYGNVVFVTADYNPYSELQYAKNYYYDCFGEESGTLFLIDMDNRKVTVFSDGAIYETVTNSYANTITDNIYQYASSGDYYGCAEEAFTEIHTLLSGRRIAQPMKYTSNFFLAILLAFIINYVVLKITSSNRKADLHSLVKATNSQINLVNPVALFTHQTKKYDPPSSSSSSSGGGGGGGSSSGGGGSHSF